jgi:hypothetical protein
LETNHGLTNEIVEHQFNPMKIHLINPFSWITVLWIMWSAIASSAPTESRTWTSAAGTSIEARATSVEQGVVTLETDAGRVIKLNMELLVESDRALLDDLFPAKPTALIASAAVTGKVLGPVEVKGSHYFY